MPLTNPFLLSRSLANTNAILTAASQIILDDSNFVGLANGTVKVQDIVERLDRTGVGSAITTFSGTFTADATNIDTWFGGKQLNRLRCIDEGSVFPLQFVLPGTTPLTTAFDQLVTNGLPEVLRFVIEYTGAGSQFLNIVPLTSPNPQIQGVTSVIVRSGTQATLEITRSGGTISSYIWQAIAGIGDTAGGTLSAVKIIPISDATWDASDGGPLPSVGVVTGNAYRVINAPSDGSGRFGQRMRDGDRVVVSTETFTSWSATPAQWFVWPLEDVIRASALDEEFLIDTQLSTVSDRNAVIRGADYADSAGEIRLKIYATPADYSAADLNTTGDIDAYTDASNQTGHLGIRLSGTQATLASTLPTLYVYGIDGSNNFTRLLNLQDDFTFEGDFGAESDYLSINPIEYTANDTLRIYVTTRADRFNNPSLDVTEDNLTEDVQDKLNSARPPAELPDTVTEFFNQASISSITHSNFRSNNDDVYLTNTGAFLKNAPTTFPNTAGAFANEITGSLVTVDDPSTVTYIQDVSSLTNNAMTGAGIVDGSFGINTQDSNNWRLIIGGWLYFETLPTSYQSILQITERDGGAYRDVFGIGPNGITFRKRNTIGATTNYGVQHPLYSTEGNLIQSMTAGDLSHDWRIYNAESYFVQATGYNGGVLQGGEAHTYVVTDVNASQAESTINFSLLEGGAQTLKFQFNSNANLFGSSAHTITVSADSIIAGLDEVRVDIKAASTTVPATSGNTYTEESISDGHVAAGRLMRYIVSFRSVGGTELGNLEADITFFGYDDQGQPRIFDENVIDLLYPALDLDWDDMVYGGTGIHQNVQMAVLNPDTPLLTFPRHSTLRTWLAYRDNKTSDWVWRNVHGPDQDTEVVNIEEFVKFQNQVFVDEATQNKFRPTVKDNGDGTASFTLTQIT